AEWRRAARALGGRGRRVGGGGRGLVAVAGAWTVGTAGTARPRRFRWLEAGAERLVSGSVRSPRVKTRGSRPPGDQRGHRRAPGGLWRDDPYRLGNADRFVRNPQVAGIR